MTTLASLKDDHIFELSWLPNDRWLLVVYSPRARMMQGQIGLLSTDGKLVPVTRDTNRYATLSLSSDNRSAATVQVKSTRSLELISAADSARVNQPKRLSEAQDPNRVVWSADGQLLVSDGQKIERMEADGRNGTVLVGDPNAAVLAFSGCGDQYLLLAWAYHTNDAVNVWRTNADGSAPLRLTSGGFDGNPICSPDGKSVYFVDRTGTSRIMRVPIDGGTARPVPGTSVPNQFATEGISFVAKDGNSLAYEVDVTDPRTSNASSKFVIANLNAGADSTPRLLDLDPRLSSPVGREPSIRLLPNQQAIAYPILDNGVGNIWVQPLDGAPGHQVTHFPSDIIADIAVSPDGKTFAVIRQQSVSDVVLLQDSQSQP